MSVKPVPDGYHSVTPYLVVESVPRLLEFLRAAFGAVETERIDDGTGKILHAEVRVGDSMVMMGEAMDRLPPMPAVLYLYVNEVDAVHRRAVQAGATSLAEPADQFYGDRSGAVKDPCGNQWWIATRVEEVSKEELNRRAARRK